MNYADDCCAINALVCMVGWLVIGTYVWYARMSGFILFIVVVV
jgi:hypothetical protein